MIWTLKIQELQSFAERCLKILPGDQLTNDLARYLQIAGIASKTRRPYTLSCIRRRHTGFNLAVCGLPRCQVSRHESVKNSALMRKLHAPRSINTS